MSSRGSGRVKRMMKAMMLLLVIVGFVYAGARIRPMRVDANAPISPKPYATPPKKKSAYRTRRPRPAPPGPFILVPKTSPTTSPDAQPMRSKGDPMDGAGAGNEPGAGTGSGRGAGRGVYTNPSDAQPGTANSWGNNPLKILSKPPAPYTDLARKNNVIGTVVLRVTFQPDGTVGPITPVRGLPYGLTEQAVAAARKIRFEPARANRKPVAVTKTVEYSFSIY